jgi:hypothetical protein
MTPSITISPALPPNSQYSLIQNFLLRNTITCTIFGEENAFLPISAIHSLATRANIEAVIHQDPGLGAIRFPNHSRSYFSDQVYKYAKELFVVAMSEKLGMDFLRILMREPHTVDKSLPLNMALRIRDENNVPWPDADTNRFLGAQRLVCAPRFTMGLYKQVAPFRSGLPIVQARRVSVRKVGEREAYEVRFHDEYLRPSKSAEPGEDGVVGRGFVMRRFAEMGEAIKDQSFEKAVFGFTCEGMYYLVGDP